MYSLHAFNEIFGCELEPLNTAGRDAAIFPAYSSEQITVWASHVFPSVAGSERLRNHGLHFPSRCCICLAAPVVWLPLRYNGLLNRLSSNFARGEPPKIPHCERHAAQPFARFVVERHSSREPLRGFYCLGLSPQFLEELRNEYTQGDMPPPWLFAPALSPLSSWGQGEEEVWVHTAWLPFWSHLTLAERKAYLMRWQASPEWQQALLTQVQ